MRLYPTEGTETTQREYSNINVSGECRKQLNVYSLLQDTLAYLRYEEAKRQFPFNANSTLTIIRSYKC